MVQKTVTMQDIADACGFSRNTVSKAFNARGGIPESTRRIILDKVKELGYRPHPRAPVDTFRQPDVIRSIALFSCQKPSRNHYGTNMITAFATRLSRAGYSLMMYNITPGEIRDCRLPASFSLEQTAGILAIELFDRDYSRMLSELGLPLIFSDTYARPNLAVLNADLISMENVNSTIALTDHLIQSGAKEIGFVGDPNHCNSFHERWSGYCKALGRANLPQRKELCILETDSDLYGITAWLVEQLDKLPEIPDAFVCANDYLAIHMMNALQKKGLSVPGDVLLSGFDGGLRTEILDVPLPTAVIPSSDIGYFAAGMLLERVERPQLPYRRLYIQTTPMLK